MTTLALTDVTIWIGGYDWTTDTNDIQLATSAEELDNSTFGAGGWRSRVGGLRSVSMDLAGWWQSAAAAAVDPQAIAALGTTGHPTTVAPDDAETTPAWLFEAGVFNYSAFGAVGAVTPFSLATLGTSVAGAVRGQVAKARGTVSGTGVVGSVLNLGAPAAGQYVYCAVHVLAAGTSLTLQLQSDTSSGMASPTTQATIGPLSAVGGTWMTRIPGALAGETHWRLNASACTGTFTVAAAIAVQ